MIELNGNSLADNTGGHDVALVNGNKEGFDSSILLAIDGACKDNSDARVSNGRRRRHVPPNYNV